MNFSVLISVYKKDRLEFVKTALESIVNQTRKPSEIVLVVDGPVDTELGQWLQDYEEQNKMVQIIVLEENLGLGNALEIGLNRCSYELVARMDADDISVENRFEKQVNEFEKDENLSIVGGQIEEFIGAVDNMVGIRKVPLQHEEIKEYMKARCPFNHMTVMFRKEEVQKVGGYMEWHCNEDYYLWLRMCLSNCRFKNLEDTLVYVRVGDEMYQRRGGIAYFKSEAGIQKYMLAHNLISFPKYMFNVLLRFTLQVLMPNKVRAFVFKRFARKEAK